MLAMLSCPAFVRAARAAGDTAAATPGTSGAVPTGSIQMQKSKALAPMAALGVGLVGTVLPTLLAYGLTERESEAEDVALFVGFTASAVAGPAVGLWSGGRGDLAKRGLIRRSIGAGLCLGSIGLASATWDNGNQAPALTTTLVILGTVGGLMTIGSVFHDLSITPSATSQGKPLTVGLGIRGDGLLAVRLRF
jgi:hypothetical protein